MTIFFRMWAFLTGQRLVWLRDFDGEVTLRPAKVTPYGLVAKRYWPFSIKDVLCVDGGRIKPNCYVEEWRLAEGSNDIPENAK